MILVKKKAGWEGVGCFDDEEERTLARALIFVAAEAVARRCSVKKGVLRNFKKFTGKHRCQSLFFNKVATLTPATLLKKRLWHSCFPVNFVEYLRTPISIEQLWWLLPSAV